jgi:hypothetical protein
MSPSSTPPGPRLPWLPGLVRTVAVPSSRRLSLTRTVVPSILNATTHRYGSALPQPSPSSRQLTVLSCMEMFSVSRGMTDSSDNGEQT